MRSKKNLILHLTFISFVINVVSVFLTCISQLQGKNLSEKVIDQENIALIDHKINLKEKECSREYSEDFLKAMPI